MFSGNLRFGRLVPCLVRWAHTSPPLFLKKKRDPCGLKLVAPLVRWPVRWLLLNKSVITLPNFWMTWLTRLEWHLRNLVGPISRTWCARPERSPTLTPIREWERTEARSASPTRKISTQEWLRTCYHRGKGCFCRQVAEARLLLQLSLSLIPLLQFIGTFIFS